MPSAAASCTSPKRWGTPTAWPIRWWACSPPPSGWNRDAWRSATRKSCSRATHRSGPRVPSPALAVGLFLAVAAPAAAFSARDMLGREVTLAAPPARIVSLVPSVTEILYALGAEERLVGVTDFCDYPPAARQRPSVGGMVNPNLEAIIALKPDLVIATTEGNSEETFAQLKRLGIPTYLVAAHLVSDVTDLIARLGALTGRERAMGPVLARLERRIEAVKRAVAPQPRPRVLYVLWPEPPIVPGPTARLAGRP